jgi:hypothetical protein
MLYFEATTHEVERQTIGKINLPIFNFLKRPEGDLVEWDEHTVEVTRLHMAVARPRMDSVLLADMQRLLQQERISTDTARHEGPPFRVDASLVETQVMRLGENLLSFKAKAEGRVVIGVRIRDTDADTVLWERSFTAVDTVRTINLTRGKYRRALSNAYCRALDMIKTALDSADVQGSLLLTLRYRTPQ